jgi:hypothetical protein
VCDEEQLLPAAGSPPWRCCSSQRSSPPLPSMVSIFLLRFASRNLGNGRLYRENAHPGWKNVGIPSVSARACGDFVYPGHGKIPIFPVVRVLVPLLLALVICFSCSSWPFARAAYQSLPKQSLLVAILVVFKRRWPFSLVFPAKTAAMDLRLPTVLQGNGERFSCCRSSDAKDFAFSSAFLRKQARRVRPAFGNFWTPFGRRDLVLANPG